MDLSVIVACDGPSPPEQTVTRLREAGAEIVEVRPGRERFAAFAQGLRRATRSQVLLLESGVELEVHGVERLAAALGDGVGIAIPALRDASGRVVFAGRGFLRTRMSPFPFEVVPLHAGEPFDVRAPDEDVDLASTACMLTTAAFLSDVGGFAERFADAYGDVDLSLRVRERGLRIVCVRSVAVTCRGRATSDDPLRVAAARARLKTIWGSRAAPFIAVDRRTVEFRAAPERYLDVPSAPLPIAAFVYGEPEDETKVEAALRDAGAPIGSVLRHHDAATATLAARAAMELRGERAIAFVDASRPLALGWLQALSRELAWGGDVVAATNGDGAALVGLADIPQHVRLDEQLELGAALEDMLAQLRPWGLATRHVDGTTLAPDFARRLTPMPPRGFASIIMLSWNAPNYTKIALESIRAHTEHPHEVIIVDNGSGPETTDWLRTLTDVRVIYNPTNLGFAGGNNVGIAAARGDYIVILNNDVVVTQGWLEDLIDALQRNALVGISAPRSNRVAGSQLLPDANYADVAAMHRYAADRRAFWRKTGYYLDRAIGFCLCVDRRVIDEIGGIDETFGAGNFEDDDFCMRARAAGYKIYVCDDVFIHHFGSVSFAANNVDYAASMSRNWLTFARKWGYPDQYPANGYQPRIAIAGGFDRARHYVKLPGAPQAAPREGAERREARIRFVALVRDESDWSIVGAFVRRFGRAFTLDSQVSLDIAACGEIAAATLGERVVKLLERERLDADMVGDIGLDDVDDVDAWLGALGSVPLFRVQSGPFGNGFDVLDGVEETSPSALRRKVETLVVP